VDIDTVAGNEGVSGKALELSRGGTLANAGYLLVSEVAIPETFFTVATNVLERGRLPAASLDIRRRDDHSRDISVARGGAGASGDGVERPHRQARAHDLNNGQRCGLR
jgi:hypothetical protein